MSPEYQMSQERQGGDAGVVPYTFTITSGTLPPDVILNSSTGDLSYQRIDAGVVPYTPSRLPAIIEEAAQAAAIACIIITALSGNMLWLAPTLPMLVVAAICERVRTK